MNNCDYAQWLSAMNPSGGEPTTPGTSNYNYFKKAEKYANTDTLALFDEYKTDKNSFLRKYLEYRVFSEESVPLNACALSLYDILEALNKGFGANDKYKVWAKITTLWKHWRLKAGRNWACSWKRKNALSEIPHFKDFKLENKP